MAAEKGTAVASGRRIGKENSETRKLLLQAAEDLMREEGYAEVTSRKLAQRAQLKPQLVHYYFRTMGDLFDALFRQSSEQYLHALDAVAKADDPLVRIFEISSDPASAALQLEFLALANHRKEMRALINEFGAKLNEKEAAILSTVMEREGIEIPGASASELATIIQTAARGLAYAGRFNLERFVVIREIVVGMLRGLSSGELRLSARPNAAPSAD